MASHVSEYADGIPPSLNLNVESQTPILVYLGSKSDVENLIAAPYQSVLQHHHSLSQALKDALKNTQTNARAQTMQNIFDFVELLFNKLQEADVNLCRFDSVIVRYGLTCFAFLNFLDQSGGEYDETLKYWRAYEQLLRQSRDMFHIITLSLIRNRKSIEATTRKLQAFCNCNSEILQFRTGYDDFDVGQQAMIDSSKQCIELLVDILSEVDAKQASHFTNIIDTDRNSIITAAKSVRKAILSALDVISYSPKPSIIREIEAEFRALDKVVEQIIQATNLANLKLPLIYCSIAFAGMQEFLLRRGDDRGTLLQFTCMLGAFRSTFCIALGNEKHLPAVSNNSTTNNTDIINSAISDFQEHLQYLDVKNVAYEKELGKRSVQLCLDICNSALENVANIEINFERVTSREQILLREILHGDSGVP